MGFSCETIWIMIILGRIILDMHQDIFNMRHNQNNPNLDPILAILPSFADVCIWLVPAQDVQFFYTRSHLSALQNWALLFSINFQFIFIFKTCITQFSHWIVSCSIFFKNISQVFIKFTHSFVAIKLLTFCNNA